MSGSAKGKGSAKKGSAKNSADAENEAQDSEDEDDAEEQPQRSGSISEEPQELEFWFGIGVKATKDRAIELREVNPASPAYQQGLREGDYVTHVDGTSVAGATVNEAMGLLVGKDSAILSISRKTGEHPKGGPPGQNK